MTAQLLPVFLKLAGRKAVLVGAGRVAAAKLPALLKPRPTRPRPFTAIDGFQ